MNCLDSHCPGRIRVRVKRRGAPIAAWLAQRRQPRSLFLSRAGKPALSLRETKMKTVSSGPFHAVSVSRLGKRQHLPATVICCGGRRSAGSGGPGQGSGRGAEGNRPKSGEGSGATGNRLKSDTPIKGNLDVFTFPTTVQNSTVNMKKKNKSRVKHGVLKVITKMLQENEKLRMRLLSCSQNDSNKNQRTPGMLDGASVKNRDEALFGWV
ncbi:uncharacterized protein LOC106702038 [Latimeria chalumnae]|uniref:uncharacterized protein LOC106702038 n=1 Tax=Latimeria chalumnae TaxID=7897 RepID=UPI0006D92537|nr:PREDICTED: uncharacterized protein LOC106702038 [Latimeria chalumnae]|eukprot:XP_014339644.1 PREDICTED: uncharacterized protein LOC106702038 [Latimeria chalumnae]